MGLLGPSVHMKDFPTRSSASEKFQQREPASVSFEEHQRKGIVEIRNLDAKILAVLHDVSPEWLEWPEARLISRQKELSTETLYTAIERGLILKHLGLRREEYELKDVGITGRTGDKLITLATSPRMQRDDWTRPCSWRACYELVKYNSYIIDTHCCPECSEGQRQNKGTCSNCGYSGQFDRKDVMECRYAVSDRI